MSREELIHGFDQRASGTMFHATAQFYLNEIHHKNTESLSRKMFWLMVGNVLLAAASATFVILSALEVV